MSADVKCSTSFYIPAYRAKNYELLKAVENNLEQCCAAQLFNVVNNIEQVVEPESSPQSGVTMLNNILLTTLNNVGRTTLLHPVFNNLHQLVIFCRVVKRLRTATTTNEENILNTPFMYASQKITARQRKCTGVTCQIQKKL